MLYLLGVSYTHIIMLYLLGVSYTHIIMLYLLGVSYTHIIMLYTETGNGADNDVRPVLCSHINSSTSKLVPELGGFPPKNTPDLVKLNLFFMYYIYDYHQYNYIILVYLSWYVILLAVLRRNLSRENLRLLLLRLIINPKMN